MIVTTYVIAAHRRRLLRRTTFHFKMRSKFGGSRSVYRPRGSIQHVLCLLTEDVRDVAGQWWAEKLYIHWPDPTKTLHTLLVSVENSIHIGASRLLLMAWVRVQNAQA